MNYLTVKDTKFCFFPLLISLQVVVIHVLTSRAAGQVRAKCISLCCTECFFPTRMTFHETVPRTIANYHHTHIYTHRAVLTVIKETHHFIFTLTFHKYWLYLMYHAVCIFFFWRSNKYSCLHSLIKVMSAALWCVLWDNTICIAERKIYGINPLMVMLSFIYHNSTISFFTTYRFLLLGKIPHTKLMCW